MTAPDKLLKEALQLKPAQKAKLVDQLLSSLDQADKEIRARWAREAESRIHAFERGKLRAVSLLLERAFKRASRLPEMDQNSLAKWLLEELEAERKWDRAFATSEPLLDRLADEALEAQRRRKTTPLDLAKL